MPSALGVVLPQRAPSTRLPRRQTTKVENPLSRTEDSRTFVRQDGKFETVFYGAPILYHDANGAWRPIDNTVVPDSCFGDNFGRSSRFVDNPAG